MIIYMAILRRKVRIDILDLHGTSTRISNDAKAVTDVSPLSTRCKEITGPINKQVLITLWIIFKNRQRTLEHLIKDLCFLSGGF